LRSVCGFFALDLRLVCPRKLDCSSESSTFMRSQTSSENTCRRGPKINFRDKAVRQYVPKMHFRRDRGFENLLEKAVFGETKLIRNHVRKAIFGETVGVRGGPKIWSENPKAVLPRNRRSENLVRKAVFEEARRVLLQPARKAIFGEAEDGPKPWSEELFSERPSWSETMFPKVSEKQFSEKPEVRKFGPKSRFRRSQGGPKTCPKSNFRRSRGWSQSYPEMCTETNFQRSREGLKSYSIFGEDRVV
jgi:hypothetical protein